jgi:ABC-type sugar transport system permease subunit/ABC-type glycerol-3-phosphate transport system substrate-binding protein
MHRHFHTAISLLAVLLLVAPDAPAGRIEDRDGQTVIYLRSDVLPDPSDPSTYSQAEVAGVQEFKRQFPRIFAEKYRARYEADPATYGRHNWANVSVELERFTGIQVAGAEVDLLAIAGGVAPDVLYINFRKSDNYIRNNFLYPLDRPEDGYLSGMTQEEIDFRINEKLWPVIQRKGPQGEKHVWAIPWGGALGKVLLFRKDLFDQKNIPHPTAKWTWDDMLAAARQLTDPRNGVYGLQLSRGKHESWYWVTYLWSAGGEVMEYREDSDEWRCVFGSRAAAEALDFYTRLGAEKWTDSDGTLRRGYSTKDAGESLVKWERGEIGMALSYIDERVFSTINPELTGMVPVPLGPGGQRGGELNSRMMGLFSGIKEPAVRDAAWEYMKFYESEEAVRIKTRVMVEGGYGPFVNPKYLRKFGYPEIERLSPPGWLDTFDIAIATGRPEPYGRNSNVAYDLMTVPIEQAEQMAIRDQLPEDREERLAVLQDLLKQAEDRANEVMIGIVPARERQLRRLAAVVVLVALVVTFTLVFRKVFRTFTPETPAGAERRASWGFRKYAWAYVLMLPAVLTVLVWQYVPLAQGAGMAFFDYRLIGHSVWVGVDNFGDLLFDSYWWAAVWNALRYSVLVIVLTFLPPIILAILLQEVPRGRLLFRLIYYLPAVVSGLVTVLLWKQFYEPSERGALNAILLAIPAVGFVAAGLALLVLALAFARRLQNNDMPLAAWAFVLAGVMLFVTVAGLAKPMLLLPGETFGESFARVPGRLFDHLPEPFRWLSNPDTAMLSCVIPMVWAGMGPGCLIYLAALKGIADDYYEAADIDGATFIDKILFVVFPILKPLLIINFVGAFIHSWYGAEGNILVMTGGSANTEVAGLHIWFKAFTFLQFGPATAMAWMLGFMLIGFTVHQLRILSRVEFRTTGKKD